MEATHDYTRRSRWVDASHALGTVEPFMIVAAQGLGSMDCELRNKEPLQGDPNTLAFSFVVTDLVYKSHLWVLGAYELVRSLDQRCRNGDIELDERRRAHVTACKQQLARFRMPLAKYEAAGKGERSIAYPARNPDGYVGWAISEDDFTTRRELAHSVLELLEDFTSFVRQA